MLIFGLAIVSRLYWVLTAIVALRVVRSIPLLSAIDPADPPRWPRVPVIIPACNEAATIEEAVRSRLGEGYPDAEYIIVDDRSTDGTGTIIDRLASEDPRIVALHVDDSEARFGNAAYICRRLDYLIPLPGGSTAPGRAPETPVYSTYALKISGRAAWARASGL